MKAAKATANDRPKSLDTLTQIVDLIIAHRFPERAPTLVELARVVSLANNSLRFGDRDEKISVENAATMAMAKKLGVISA